jgi:hypothetical protein
LAVVTVIGPVAAPAGTVTETQLPLMLLDIVAGLPLKLTPVAPRRKSPLTVTPRRVRCSEPRSSAD